jgi:hypothetical protein
MLYLITFQQRAPATLLLSLGHIISYRAVILILVSETNVQNSCLVSYFKIPFTLVFPLDIEIHVVVVGKQICLGDFVFFPAAREYCLLV